MKRQPVQVIFAPPAAGPPTLPTPEPRQPASPPPPSERRQNRKPWFSPTVIHRFRLFALPPILYSLCYFALTFPNILSWRTRFFCDWGDGLQNVWNLWWVDYAVTTLRTSPWFTRYLHFPHGTTLLGHTLNPLNGFISIPLLAVLPLVIVHNLIVVFCFAASGTTMFWLARKLTDSYWPSVIAGYAFTFSAYHWAHAPGHMQLTSMEWIPLFLLLWLMLLEGPRFWLAPAAAAALAAVELCDFYYFFYCVIAGVILFIAEAIHRRKPLFFAERQYLIVLGSFVGFSLLLCGPLPIALLRQNAADPLQGSHPADMFYADLLAPLIPSQMWRWSELTRGYWSHLFPSPAEMSVSLGVGTILAAGYAVFLSFFSRKPKAGRTGTWLTLGIVFFILSLGRRLHVFGKELTGPIMPYRWLETIVPPVKLSGCPSRMMVMTTLTASLLAAMGIKKFVANYPRLLWPAGGVFLAMLIIESIPTPMPTMPCAAPDWALRLGRIPGDDVGVIFVNCPTLTPGDQLFAQTIDHKPMAMGYIARIPTSVLQKDAQIVLLLQAHNLRALLLDQKIRYIVTDGTEPPTPYGIIYEAPHRRIYDLNAIVQ